MTSAVAPAEQDELAPEEALEAQGLLAETEKREVLPPRARFRDSLHALLCSPYFYACLVYLVYTCQTIAIDYCHVFHPDVLAGDGDYAGAAGTAVPSPQCREKGNSSINRQYVGLASVHVVNAFQFAGAWLPWLREHWRVKPAWFVAAVLAPEALNILEAALYLRASTTYAAISLNPACADGPAWYACADLAWLHRLELTAACIELVASGFWLWCWAATHEPGPGRGWTPRDLDCWSSLLLVGGSVLYVVFNVQITLHPETYRANRLYRVADATYFIGAILYLLASLRDADCFFWLAPGHGAAGKAGEMEMVGLLARRGEEEVPASGVGEGKQDLEALQNRE